MPAKRNAKLYIIDTSAERRDHEALQEIRAGLLARVGELGKAVASPRGAHIGQDIYEWFDLWQAMGELLERAAGVVDAETARKCG